MASKPSKKPATRNKTADHIPAKKVQSSRQEAPNPFNLMEMKMTANTNKQFEKFSQDAAAAAQESMEAFVKSGTIFAQGMESIMKTCMAMAQSTAEKSQDAAKAMMTCKTINELTEAQSKFAQSSFDEFMTGATKISEMGVKVCTDCLEPINSQVGKTMNKVSKAA